VAWIESVMSCGLGDVVVIFSLSVSVCVGLSASCNFHMLKMYLGSDVDVRRSDTVVV
jgi:hypothetical protein